MKRVAVFASGAGSTLQALVDHARRASAHWTVALVLSDQEGCGACARANREGIPTEVVPVSGRTSDAIAGDQLAALSTHRIDLVVLAGYLRLVPVAVVDVFLGRMLNIHPALLPGFGGKGMYGDHVHRAVLEAGVRVTGPTVHWVTTEYDRGRPLAQWPVPVRVTDTVETLRARVQEAERTLYPLVVDHVSSALDAGQTPTALDWTGEWLRIAAPAESNDPLTLMRNSCV